MCLHFFFNKALYLASWHYCIYMVAMEINCRPCNDVCKAFRVKYAGTVNDSDYAHAGIWEDGILNSIIVILLCSREALIDMCTCMCKYSICAPACMCKYMCS